MSKWCLDLPSVFRMLKSKLWCWKRYLRVPWKTRRSNQTTLKESTPEYSLEGPMLNAKSQLIGKDFDAGKIEGRKRRG